MTKFLIDTADIVLIESTLEGWCGKVIPGEYKIHSASSSSFTPPVPLLNNWLGVTTNPSAFNKAGKNSLGEWIGHIRELSFTIGNWGRDKEIHIQIPYSRMSKWEILDWIELIKSAVNKRVTPILKISPFTPNKEELRLRIKLNVTGLADAAIALSCHDVDYVSIIPGRMEEKGIDASSHVRYATQRGKVPVIAGSMRTVDGLKRSIEDGAIPTIGPSVLSLIKEDPSVLFTKPESIILSEDTAFIDARHNTLRQDFFAQMDKLGAQCYKEFSN